MGNYKHRGMISPLPVLMDKNCAILERTADGRSVGRCFFHVGDADVCPRHGDVFEVQEHYRKTGNLSEDPGNNA